MLEMFLNTQVPKTPALFLEPTHSFNWCRAYTLNKDYDVNVALKRYFVHFAIQKYVEKFQVIIQTGP